MEKFKKKIKVQHQGTGAAINIPKLVSDFMGIKYGDILSLEYDFVDKEITLRKENNNEFS